MASLEKSPSIPLLTILNNPLLTMMAWRIHQVAVGQKIGRLSVVVVVNRLPKAG
ncbi:MAG: hypothetical protein LBT86_02935 [Deltaproteobacteria bacterium]|jgi:hypothetical protein|nr:hypothetical protein [Deltaproteobacteria bacterium]